MSYGQEKDWRWLEQGREWFCIWDWFQIAKAVGWDFILSNGPQSFTVCFSGFYLSSFKCECQAVSCSELVDCFGRAYLNTLWTKFQPGSSVGLCLKTFIYEIAPKISCTEMANIEVLNSFIIWDSSAVWWLPACIFWEFDSAELKFFFQSGYHEENPSGTWDYCRPSESNVMLD